MIDRSLIKVNIKNYKIIENNTIENLIMLVFRVAICMEFVFQVESSETFFSGKQVEAPTSGSFKGCMCMQLSIELAHRYFFLFIFSLTGDLKPEI